MGRRRLCPNRSELILKAASELFAEYSYEKTTMEEIALRAGISKGSIYLEFNSKEEILFALILQNKEIQLAQMKKQAARTDKPALDLLKTMLVQNMGAVFDSVKRNRRSPEEMMQTRERLRAHLKPWFEARLALVEELLKRAFRNGEIAEQQDFHRSAQLVMLSLRGVLPPYMASASRVKLQHEAAELLELLFTGLGARRYNLP